MPIFRSFSGTTDLPVAEMPTLGHLRANGLTSGNLADIVDLVRSREAVGWQAGGHIHAVGSGWAFSAPAYTPDTVVTTERLAGWPEKLQSAVTGAAAPGRAYLAVEAGMKVRDFYLSLDGHSRELTAPDIPDNSGNPFAAGDAPSVPQSVVGAPGPTRRRLAPLTLGGAGGQSLAGVVNTGTHGGDAARPPISDSVRAMILVGSGGTVRLVQPSGGPVDVVLLRANYASEGIDIVDASDTDAFNAAVVSVGRFGIVYAYVLELADETGLAWVEHRFESQWSRVKAQLTAPGNLVPPPHTGGLVQNAVAGDQFLQILINPALSGTEHTAWVTTHRLVDNVQDPQVAVVPNIGPLFGLAPTVGSHSVMDERSGPRMTPLDVGQILALSSAGVLVGPVIIGELLLLASAVLAIPVVGIILSVAIADAITRLLRVGPDYLLGRRRG